METAPFDKLAHEACHYVFDCMISEKAAFVSDSHLVGEGANGTDTFGTINDLDVSFYSISVGYEGDAEGTIFLTMTRQLAERFTCKLHGAASIEWIDSANPQETIRDTMGELVNSYVGLIKGALTRFYPRLMLTTPEVRQGRRIQVDSAHYRFRKQYHFTAMGSAMMVDFCHK